MSMVPPPRLELGNHLLLRETALPFCVQGSGLVLVQHALRQLWAVAFQPQPGIDAHKIIRFVADQVQAVPDVIIVPGITPGDVFENSFAVHAVFMHCNNCL